MKNALVKIPKLKSGHDDAVAAKLNEMIQDASDGLRRIVMVGFFLERIAADLKHSEFKPWVEAHCAGVHRASVFRWRLIARNVMEAVKLSKVALCDFSTPVHEMLALPEGKVPKEQKELREKIDDLIAGKSARQLFLEFKQAEEDEDGSLKKKHGRLKGQGGASAAQRAAAKAAEEEALTTEANISAEETARLIRDNADAANWGQRLSEKNKAAMDEACRCWLDYRKKEGK